MAQTEFIQHLRGMQFLSDKNKKFCILAFYDPGFYETKI